MGSDNKSLLEQLEKLRGSKTVILGIGNTLKGDDGAGPLVCEGLSGKVCAEVMDVGTVPENYIQPIIKKRPQNLVIIDAIDFGGLVGEIKVFKPEQIFVDPDCGLKTRTIEESIAKLKVMVEATEEIRKEITNE